MNKEMASIEYRILGKNGGECFRSHDYSLVRDKCYELREKCPKVHYKVQSRQKQYTAQGDFWSAWIDEVTE